MFCLLKKLVRTTLVMASPGLYFDKFSLLMQFRKRSLRLIAN